MHAGVVRMYVDAAVRMLAPIAPHWADHVFRNLLKAGDTVLTAGWPQLAEPDFALKMAAEYVAGLIKKVRAAIDKKEAPPKKKKGAPRTWLPVVCRAPSTNITAARHKRQCAACDKE